MACGLKLDDLAKNCDLNIFVRNILANMKCLDKLYRLLDTNHNQNKQNLLAVDREDLLELFTKD